MISKKNLLKSKLLNCCLTENNTNNKIHDNLPEKLKTIKDYLYEAVNSLINGKCKSETIQFIEDSIIIINEILEDKP